MILKKILLINSLICLSNICFGQKGAMTDPRDGKEYKTINVGQQTWMAENLSYNDPNNTSDCYKDSLSNCVKYGRLYTWEVANKVCPEGWRLPDKSEFEILLNYAGGGDKKKAFEVLTAGSGLGFNALLGGLYSYSTPTVFHPTGYHAVDGETAFWTSTVSSSKGLSKGFSLANLVGFNRKKKTASLGVYWRKSAISVRCIKD